MTDKTGAELMAAALAELGVDTCFANPGTSEMHLVAALERRNDIRAVLCPFEGVATGAADGYGRMRRLPAATLLHLGPGLANGWSNLHNARRADTPIINLVGDHARDHRHLDAPLNSDLRGLAGTCSVHVSEMDDRSAHDAVAEVWRASLGLIPGIQAGPTTLIVPADLAWSPRASTEECRPKVTNLEKPQMMGLGKVAEALKAARRPIILFGGSACHEAGIHAAARLSAAGIDIYTETFPARQARGEGRFAPLRLPYFGEDAAAALDGHDLLVLIGAKAPVAFFAYPGRPSLLAPRGIQAIDLTENGADPEGVLVALADALDAPSARVVVHPASSALPTGSLTPQSVGISLARHMPEHSIVSDDAVSSGGAVFAATREAALHDWLCLTGGSIGQGLPVAVGAAIAEPARKVIALSGDGAAMYMPQALWVMARERLNVTAVIFANSAYRILEIERARTGAGSGPHAEGRLLQLDGPKLDWLAMSESMGVTALRCSTAEGFDATLQHCIAESGPTLIEAVVP